MTILSYIKGKDLEGILALPLHSLAKWVGVEYNGEFRNGCAAHVGWGWALTLTLGLITPYLVILPILYGIYRELEDAKFKLSNLNKKSVVDLATWEFGCLIGFIINLIRS